MKRKFFSLVAIMLVFTCAMALPANAVVAAETTESYATPRYVNIRSIVGNIEVSDSGIATCYGYVKTANSTYTIYLTLGLQQYNGSSWDTIKTWSTSGTGEVSYTKTRYVADGYYYRTAVSATVYTSGGSYVESTTIYSDYT